MSDSLLFYAIFAAANHESLVMILSWMAPGSGKIFGKINFFLIYANFQKKKLKRLAYVSIYYYLCTLFMRKQDKTMAKNIIITESQFNNLVENIAAEASISAKKRNEKNVENLFTKKVAGYNNIKTLAVFTAQNPDSQAASGTLNKKLNHSLIKALKEGRYLVVPAKGKFGNTENSFAVINISLEATKVYCGKFQQTSFVFTELNGDTIVNYYYEKEDTEKPYSKVYNPYVLRDTAEGYTDMSDAEDYFTVIGDRFKFSIPFPSLSECATTIEKNYLNEDNKKYFNGKSLNDCIDFTINRVGVASARIRNLLYKI